MVPNGHIIACFIAGPLRQPSLSPIVDVTPEPDRAMAVVTVATTGPAGAVTGAETGWQCLHVTASAQRHHEFGALTGFATGGDALVRYDDRTAAFEGLVDLRHGLGRDR